MIKSDLKMAAIFSIVFMNLRQAQVEKTMNINMSAQTILTKFANYIHPTKIQSGTSILDYQNFLKNFFDLVSFKKK